MQRIKYIGKKEFFADFIAQSGKSWNGYGDVQEVTADQAKKLLVHDDEFAEQGAHDALLIEQEAAALAEQEDVARREQAALDGTELELPGKAPEATAEEIGAMNKRELLALAAAKSISINDGAPVSEMRMQLIAALFTD